MKINLSKSPAVKSIPENLSVSVLSKWMENDQIKMRLLIRNDRAGKEMRIDYRGGIMAFLPNNEAKRTEIHSLLNSRVNPHLKNCLEDEENRKRGMQLALEWAKPDPMGIFSSLILDADCGAMPFHDFCGEMGYDEDSRSALSTWNLCESQGRELRELLGDQFDEIRELVQDY